jgi:hypothetical protein
MEPTLRLLSVVLIICGLILAGVGCSSTNAPSDHASGLVVLASEGTITGPTGPKEIEMLLAEVARLRLAAQESFAAASLIGTTEAQLAGARAALGRADQLIREGQTVAARDSQESRRQLQAAESALRQAEEAAVRAGLTRIEHELAKGYAQVLTPKFGARRQLLGLVRVTHSVANLRGGAGTDFRVVGKARERDTLNLMAEVGNWYHVRTRDGVEGWVSKDLVTRVPGL